MGQETEGAKAERNCCQLGCRRWWMGTVDFWDLGDMSPLAMQWCGTMRCGASSDLSSERGSSRASEQVSEGDTMDASGHCPVCSCDQPAPLPQAPLCLRSSPVRTLAVHQPWSLLASTGLPPLPVTVRYLHVP